MMVRFELARPLTATLAEPAAAGTQNKVDRSRQLVLEPSRVLHPRFDPATAGQAGQTRGKGLWVACWSEAVEALAKKGQSPFIRRPHEPP